MARVLLIVPSATYRAREFLAAAGRLGVEVVTASDQPQALSSILKDAFLTVALDDPVAAADSIVAFAQRVALDAVVAVDDQGSFAAACASERLGLVHNPPDAVAATRHKAEMRRRLSLAEVAQPAFRVVSLDATPAENGVVDAASDLGYPVVVKPISLSGSRGVIRADNDDGALAAAVRIGRLLDSLPEEPRTLLVESFAPGPEVAVEGLLVDGEFRCLAIFDKPDPLDGPYFEETIYVTPSRHDPVTLESVIDAIARAATALGLREGPIHGEARLGGGDHVVVVEVAARTIGGKCASALRFAIGVTLEEIVLRHALGETFAQMSEDFAAATGSSGVMMLPIPESGTLVGIDGTEEVLATPGVTELEIAIAPGRTVQALPEGSRYLGFLFAQGPTPEAVERSLRDGNARLVVEIAPIDPMAAAS